MKKATTYLPSLIISLLLVFAVIAGSAITLVDINFTGKKLKKLAEKNKLEAKIYTEIEKHYSDKYNTTGVPAEVYMTAVDEEYIRSCEAAYIDAAFAALEKGSKMSAAAPRNQALEDSIDGFFNDFADKNGYTKDESFEKKLSATKDSAYSAVGSFCDVYKFSAMNEHGVLSKLSQVYSKRFIMTAAALVGVVILILLLTLVNRKKKIIAMYWCGASALIAGIMGSVPCIYLLVTKYFDSFSIKQAPVFTAFTSAMYRYTEAFIAVQIAFIVIGISLLVTYGVIHDKKKYPDTKPTEI